MNKENLTAYEVVTEENLTDIHSTGWLLRHKKTGARVMLIENDDENKVFNIAFRTPPKDSTGVAHILEHSVLCGSREFPLKDPFVELVKGSLNTFLNAMTYPDKTCYPVASCNDKDFQNLMHVYLDAVFYPNIYKREEIFRQEGWNYHLEQKEGPLKYNGVVYNEMKGVFSSPDDVLARKIQEALLKDTPYAYESGGDPDAIPELTREKFLDFHSKYYHPSNSYIYLYGNVDFAKELEFIDEEYLSHYEKKVVDSEVALQKPFLTPETLKDTYSVSEEEEEGVYLSYNVAAGDSCDNERGLAMQILDYVLFTMPGAPVRKKLIDAGLGKDVDSYYDGGIQQPLFSIIVKNAGKGKENLFIQTVEEALKEQVEKGLNKKAIYSAINNYGAAFAKGEYLLLLNNDTEIINEDCLEELLGYCMRSDVGAVGARMYYEDDTIQHAGVVIGFGGIAGHCFVLQPRGTTGYCHRIICAQDYSAVTAACMMVKREAFDKVGGLTEELAVAFNDIDFCMKLREAGYLIVYNPYAELYHYESKSRGLEDTPEKVARFNKEIQIFERRWPDIMRDGDPYYNPNLTLKSQDFSLKRI